MCYTSHMDTIQKFYADVQRIIKHDRSDNGGNYDGLRASKTVAKHFIALQRGLGELPCSIADYWEQTYILPSLKQDAEPTVANITWLAAALSLLDESFAENATAEEKAAFSKKDWKELCDLVNCEAGELPIDLLTSLMAIFTEQKAI